MFFVCNTAYTKATNYCRLNPLSAPAQYEKTVDGMLVGFAKKSSNGKGKVVSDAVEAVSKQEVITVPDTKTFFNKVEMGKKVKSAVQKTRENYQGNAIYRVMERVEYGECFFAKGDYFYLDRKHLDHLEIFSSDKTAKSVFNLNGTINAKKAKSAIKEGRRIK